MRTKQLILCSQMHAYQAKNICRFGNKLVDWIQSFLSNHEQVVVLNGVRSDLAKVLGGVPQGTVLRTILFIILSCSYLHKGSFTEGGGFQMIRLAYEGEGVLADKNVNPFLSIFGRILALILSNFLQIRIKIS